MLNSISALGRTIAGAAIAAAVALPLPAHAATWQITATGDPASASPVGSNPVVYDLPLTITSVNGGAVPSPFNIAAGDEFLITVSLLAPLQVPGGGLQTYGINFVTNNPPTGPIAAGTLAVNGGPEQDFLCGNCLAALITTSPANALTLNELVASMLVLFTDDTLVLEGLRLSYSVVDPANETPLPAALPLFASGLAVMGIVARRRKKKAQATA